jgi:mRNA interferase RelE/StbE
MPDNQPYSLEITLEAQDDLRRIDKTNAERIVRKLRWLAENAAEVKHDALTGQWAGYYRWRIGDYRAIYELEHQGRILIVAVVGHRREVYDE